MADCLMKNNRKEDALQSYLFVANAPKNMFSEKSLLMAADLSYQQKEYAEANKLYKRIENESEVKANRSSALIKIMQTEFELKHYDSVLVYADKIKNSDIKTDNYNQLDEQITYILANSYYNIKDTANAMKEFAMLKKSKNGQYSGQATYIEIEKMFNENKLDQTEKAILKYSANPTDEYYLAKSIVLLGDIYQKKGKTKLALQTYQSIVDNYDGVSLVELCRQKIDALTPKSEIRDGEIQKENKEQEEIILNEQ
jgi:tetratricopeptide (TPR) repeat protein